MIITITDIRKAGHCVRGAKTWFEEHGLDFADMLVNGIEEEKLAIDALGQQVVDYAHANRDA